MNRKTSTLLSLGVSAVLIAVGVWFLHNNNMGIWPGGNRWDYGHHGMMVGGMSIVMIISWIVLIAAFVLLISGAVSAIRNPDRSNTDNSPDPLEILKQRYARGEINKTEYEEKRQTLIV